MGSGGLDAASPEAAPPSLELELSDRRVPLGFVPEGDRIYLVAGDRSSRWPTEALRAGRASVRVADRSTSGPIALLTDPDEKRRVLDLFRERYGPAAFDRWYAGAARVLVVQLGNGGGSLGPGVRYHDWLAAEFDNVAADYDRHITGNRINRLLRDRSLAELRRAFSSSHRLLEIGCGSGMETLPLLEEGHELVCVDISSAMLEVVRAKARARGVSERLETVHLAASELPQLLSEEGPQSFDGGYSTYGALNCEADLGALVHALAELLPPDRRFVAGVYNRWCLFELAGYGATGRWSRAFGRTRRPIPVGSSRFCVDVFALSAAELARQFAPAFSPERVEGVPVILPPSDLVGYVDRLGRGFERLAELDRVVGRRWPFNRLGDHFLTTFKRRGSAN